MSVSRVLREGFEAALIGAGATAAWFLLVDTIAGHPLYTPAVLGSAILWGVQTPALVVVSFSRVIGYSMVHVGAFLVIGAIAAWLAAMVEGSVPRLYFVVVLFGVFEFGFYATLAILAQPLLGALAWWNVAIANGIASYAMGHYLWHLHPAIAHALKNAPLGATEDGE